MKKSSEIKIFFESMKKLGYSKKLKRLANLTNLGVHWVVMSLKNQGRRKVWWGIEKRVEMGFRE